MNHSLKPRNTFGIERFAKTIVRAPKLSNSC